MKEQQNENLFLALGEVGGDLVDLAERGTFRASAWRRWGALAACMALLIGLAAWTLPKLGIRMSGTTKAMSNGAAEPVAAAEKVRFRYTYYYLEDEAWESPADLGVQMGVIEAADTEALIDCPVYHREGATEYTNHSVHGLSVYQQIYVQLPEGYVLATTYNEKSISRYSFEDVACAMEEGDAAWVVDSLAAPLIRYAEDVTFASPDALSSEQLNRLFLASTQLNTGVDVSQQWLSAGGSSYVIPTADVQWRLDRFLTDYSYRPSKTEAYDPQREALVYPASALQQDAPLYLALAANAVDADGRTVVLTVVRYADEAMQQRMGVYTYVISFHTDSWHYEQIIRES